MPAHSMSGLLARVTSSPTTHPGPGTYTIRGSIGSSPRYTFKGRHVIPERPNTAPYRELPSTIGTGRSATLSSRYERPATASPGPSYVPPPLGSSARRSALSSRHEPTDPRAGVPGPGRYRVPAPFGRSAPKFTFRGRTPVAVYSNDSPGPATYRISADAGRSRAPAATLHSRPPESVKRVGSGYFDLGSTLTRKGCTIGRRETLDVIRA
jgi:hypothetical protein